MTWKHTALSTLVVQAYMLGLYINRLSGNNTVNIIYITLFHQKLVDNKNERKKTLK